MKHREEPVHLPAAYIEKGEASIFSNLSFVTLRRNGLILNFTTHRFSIYEKSHLPGFRNNIWFEIKTAPEVIIERQKLLLSIQEHILL
jgi:hypothetical protein